jgi:hypothetical protein
MSSTPPPPHGSTSIRLKARAATWDKDVPPLFRPVLRAYLLGYAFSVGPRLLALVLHHALRTVRRRHKPTGGTAEDNAEPRLLESLTKTVRAGLEWQRFPAFCAALVGGSTLLEVWPCLDKGLGDRSVGRLANQPSWTCTAARPSQVNRPHLARRNRNYQVQVSNDRSPSLVTDGTHQS